MSLRKSSTNAMILPVRRQKQVAYLRLSSIFNKQLRRRSKFAVAAVLLATFALPTQLVAKTLVPELFLQEQLLSQIQQHSATELQLQLVRELRAALHISYRLACLTHPGTIRFSNTEQDKFSVEGEQQALAEICRRIAAIADMDVTAVHALFEVGDADDCHRRWREFVRQFFPGESWFFHLDITVEFKCVTMQPFPSVTLAPVLCGGTLPVNVLNKDKLTIVAMVSSAIYVEPFKQFMGYPYAHFSVYPPNKLLIFHDKTREMANHWETLAAAAPTMNKLLQKLEDTSDKTDIGDLRKQITSLFINEAIRRDIKQNALRIMLEKAYLIGAQMLVDMRNEDLMYCLDKLCHGHVQDVLLFRGVMSSIVVSGYPLSGWAMFQYYRSYLYEMTDKALWLDRNEFFNQNGYIMAINLFGRPHLVKLTEGTTLSSYIKAHNYRKNSPNDLVERDFLYGYVQLVNCPDLIIKELALHIIESFTAAVFIKLPYALRKTGKPMPREQALRLTERGLNLQPATYEKLLAAATYLTYDTTSPKAKQLFRDIVENKEGTAAMQSEAAYKLAMMLRSAKKWQEAFTMFSHAVRLDPKHMFEGYARLGSLYYTQYEEILDYEKALEMYGKFLEHAPADHQWIPLINQRINLMRAVLSSDNDIDKRLKSMSMEAQLAAAEAETTCPVLLTALATSNNPLIRYLVAKNRATPDRTLVYLFSDEEEIVRNIAQEAFSARQTQR